MREAVAEVPILRLEGLTRFFGERAALDSVSFSINSGEYVSLLGPSGSGKTVLLRAIAGFETLQSGRVLLKGEDVTPRPPYLRDIGFVFQNFALFPHLSVFDNVAFSEADAPPNLDEWEMPPLLQASHGLLRYLK